MEKQLKRKITTRNACSVQKQLEEQNQQGAQTDWSMWRKKEKKELHLYLSSSISLIIAF